MGKKRKKRKKKKGTQPYTKKRDISSTRKLLGLIDNIKKHPIVSITLLVIFTLGFVLSTVADWQAVFGPESEFKQVKFIRPRHDEFQKTSIENNKVFEIRNAKDANTAISWLKDLLHTIDQWVSINHMDVVFTDGNTDRKDTHTNWLPSDVIKDIRRRQIDGVLPFRVEITNHVNYIREKDGSPAIAYYGIKYSGPAAGLCPPSTSTGLKIPPDTRSPLSRYQWPDAWLYSVNPLKNQHQKVVGFLLRISPKDIHFKSWAIAIPVDDAPLLISVYADVTSNTWDASRRPPSLPGPIDAKVFGASEPIGDDRSIFIAFKEPPSRLYLGRKACMIQLDVTKILGGKI